MTWTAPATAVANTILTAAFWNTHVRDNLLETAPAKATTAGQLFQATAANAIAALNAVAYRMPRGNAAGNLMEYVASLNLAQAPVWVEGSTNPAASPSYGDCVTQSFTTHGGIVIVFGSVQITEIKTGSAQFTHFGRIMRDTTQIGNGRTNQIASVTNAITNIPLFVMETPAAGTYTYKVQGQYLSSSTSGTPSAIATILLVELAP